MTDEQELLANFRAINDRQQKNMVRAMSAAAKRFPRDCVVARAPILTLVKTTIQTGVDDDLGERLHKG